jgi:hypothetical protein
MFEKKCQATGNTSLFILLSTYSTQKSSGRYLTNRFRSFFYLDPQDSGWSVQFLIALTMSEDWRVLPMCLRGEVKTHLTHVPPSCRFPETVELKSVFNNKGLDFIINIRLGGDSFSGCLAELQGSLSY